MQHTILTLKKQVAELEQERTMLKSRAQRSEAEVGRKERQLETMLQVSSGSLDRKSVHFDKLKTDMSLLKALKAKNKALSRKLRDKEAELEGLKADSRYTRVAERDMQLQTYYKETVRLRQLLEERAEEQSLEEEEERGGAEREQVLEGRIRALRAENKELKADSQALVLKSAEWEQENRYLQAELLQAHKKVQALPKREATAQEALHHSTTEIEQLRSALQQAATRAEAQAASHSTELAQLKALLAHQSKRSRDKEALEADYELRLGQETAALRAQVQQLQAGLKMSPALLLPSPQKSAADSFTAESDNDDASPDIKARPVSARAYDFGEDRSDYQANEQSVGGDSTGEVSEVYTDDDGDEF
eukprot:TRINITY_DN14181_c0_g1_i2.p1 TRINITY_DN14181_c0_g1~~TRINITY_DN14181_c0_g1_i2.p1  ORF type:complete len:363 (+),score=171.99 TRINITY_DN14181_c0_g1_i2:413-1501(+)